MKKRIMEILAGFLAVMLLFTVLSRTADSVGIPQVTTARASRGKISHQVNGSGQVVQNREQAIATEPNQRVKTIYVEEGQQVEAGEVLFELELDTLKEQILEMKQEMKIAELQSEDKASSRAADAWKRSKNQSRAAEDYQVQAGKGQTAVSRAAAELRQAKKNLKALEEGSGTQDGTDGVELVLMQALEQKKAEYEQAVQDKELLQKEIDQVVEQALADARNAAGIAGDLTRADLVEKERSLRTAAQESEEEGAGKAQETEENGTGKAQETMETAKAAEALLTANMPEAPQNTDGGDTGGDTGGDAEEDFTEELVEEIPVDSASGEEEGTTVIDPSLPQDTEPSAGNDPSFGGSSLPSSENTAPSQAELDLLERRVRQQNQFLLDEAQAVIEQKERERDQAEAAWNNYLQSRASQEQVDKESVRAQLEAEVKAKQQAYADAVTAANDGLRSAGRTVEDASAPEGTDSTGEIDAITREQQELKLSKLEKLLKAQGKIASPISGIVTKVNLTTGDRTPDGTAIMLADTEKGTKLAVQIPMEQEKYLARGDEVIITPAGNKKPLEGYTVDTVRTNEENRELLDVSVRLPGDLLEIGTSAELECTKTSESYDICVPVQALRVGEQNQYFVLVLQETNSILGTELTARRVDVTVLDKNESTAALAPGTLGSNQDLIVDSDRYVEAGSRVRLKEEG